MTLQRLVLTFKPEELVVHALYRTEGSAGPNTKARAREVSGLAREGLREALSALEGDVAMVGTSGFTQREDIMLANRKESAA
ncbi:MAG: hypothetical protein M3426_06275 [Actinomycetota bacterium]|jgi:hypothetical protein|nr:hypothetical protein [Actinomycetota bacterium]